MTQVEQISLEDVLERCGDFGRYQLVHYIFLNLMVISGTINALYYVFGVAEPSFRCRLPSTIWPDDSEFQSINMTHQLYISNWSSPNSRCESMQGVTCSEFVYDRSVFGKTFTEEANLICSSTVKRTWVSTTLQIGTGCTALVTGLVGDKIGRKRTIQIVVLYQFLFTIVSQLLLQFVSMSVNLKFGLLLLNQFVTSTGAFNMVFLLLMELTSSKYTTIAGNLALVSFTLGEIITTAFAYVARDWLKLKWFNSIFHVLALFYVYLVPESPYWLANQNKFNQLESCLRTIAKRNCREDSEWFAHFERFIKISSTSSKLSKNPIKNKRLNRSVIMRMMASGCIGFTTMLLYIKITYGLAEMDDTLGPYWNTVLGAVVESVGYISASLLMVTRMGRRFSLMFYTVLTSGCVLAIPFLQMSYSFVLIAVSQVGKLMVSGAVCVSWVYIPELFPTSMRGFGNAVLVVLGRFGAILAPIIDAAINERYRRITFYVYSAAVLLIVLLLCLLPETRNQSFNNYDETAADLSPKHIYSNSIARDGQLRAFIAPAQL